MINRCGSHSSVSIYLNTLSFRHLDGFNKVAHTSFCLCAKKDICYLSKNYIVSSTFSLSSPGGSANKKSCRRTWRRIMWVIECGLCLAAGKSIQNAHSVVVGSNPCQVRLVGKVSLSCNPNLGVLAASVDDAGHRAKRSTKKLKCHAWSSRQLYI